MERLKVGDVVKVMSNRYPCRMPKGEVSEVVTVYGDSSDWCQIKYTGKGGPPDADGPVLKWTFPMSELKLIKGVGDMKNKKETADGPTLSQSKAYQKAFDYFNKVLFDDELSVPMLGLTRSSKVIGGLFSKDRWCSEEGVTVHEISININSTAELDVKEVMGILVHEMVHQWQYEHGKPTRNGYHNRQWVEKAESLGLVVQGKGQVVSTSVAVDGVTEKAIMDMPDDALFPWVTTDLDLPGGGGGGSEGKGAGKGTGAGKSGKRAKYTCSQCGLNAWAKAGSKLICGDCERAMVEQV